MRQCQVLFSIFPPISSFTVSDKTRSMESMPRIAKQDRMPAQIATAESRTVLVWPEYSLAQTDLSAYPEIKPFAKSRPANSSSHLIPPLPNSATILTHSQTKATNKPSVSTGFTPGLPQELPMSARFFQALGGLDHCISYFLALKADFTPSLSLRPG